MAFAVLTHRSVVLSVPPQERAHVPHTPLPAAQAPPIIAERPYKGDKIALEFALLSSVLIWSFQLYNLVSGLWH